MELAEKILPNCTSAYRWIEKGMSRDLNFMEMRLLKYHMRLCPYCGCQRNRADRKLQKMMSIERKGQASKESLELE